MRVDRYLYLEFMTMRCATCCATLELVRVSPFTFSASFSCKRFWYPLMMSLSFACKGIGLFSSQKSKLFRTGTESSLTL